MPKGYPDPSTTCSIPGCGKARKSRGWCSMHYSRWIHHGDPLALKRYPRDGSPKVFGGLCLVPLSSGRWAITDATDYAIVRQHKWFWREDSGISYAAAVPAGTKDTLLLHRSIMGFTAGDGRRVDHINRNGLDNRRCNLREADASQNGANAKLRTGYTSVYRGVSLPKGQRKWRASIGYKGRVITLGSHEDEVDAAKAYDRAARELHGEFAFQNFPDES